ncbi:ornithine cyclodeaminase family protein [Epibacterium sp. SM1969]|uniref:Ornithine cyclodeaminase family protein n=1 Tax=Tritonibacter aquimaris TaxID=2663379 RepID=A0A844B0D2_9RHOB|nr:ornithine cyclodeaminase family protein [Tritonibacter aquimaris]MQY43732.1 ornithine cyclodeaminase family protein [Tritonibacter aquimaris]
MIQLDKAQIQDLFDFETAVDAVRAAYVAFAQGRVQTPPVTYLGFPEVAGDCHVKSGHIAGDGAFVIKIATGFYNNPAQGLPSSNGMNLVLSAETGAPLALLQDEGWLTDIRTGIGGALATHALAVAGFERFLIVGTGLQARHQAQCLQQLVPDRRLAFSIWGRDAQKAKAVAQDLTAAGLLAQNTEDLPTACKAAQAIVATTPAQRHLIARDWIGPGTHITAIGADCPDKQELEAELTAHADLLVCDSPEQALDHGEFQTLHKSGRLTEADVVTLGDILSRDHQGRLNSSQITIADLTGLAAQDIAISQATLKKLSAFE